MWQIGCSVRFSDWSVLVQDKAQSCSLSLVSLCTQLLFLVSDFDQILPRLLKLLPSAQAPAP